MWKLTLPHSEAHRLLRVLALDGVNAATVFRRLPTALSSHWRATAVDK
jgi:hypothetical protein